MIVKLTDLVGRPVWLNARELVTMREHDIGTAWQFTELHVADQPGEILRVKERATHIAQLTKEHNQ